MIRVETCNIQSTWDDYIVEHDGHPLQLWGWGDVKAAHNWKVERVFIYDDSTILGAAQLLIRRLPWPLNALVYIPRGPVTGESDRTVILDALAQYAKHVHRAAVITIEPHWRTLPKSSDWQLSSNTILIPHTLILDLKKSEDELMAPMAKKTRQYIRKSLKEGIEIRRVTKRTQLAACLAIYRQTAQRAGFAIHSDQYYYDIFDKLGDHSPVFAAFEGDQPVAFLWLVISGSVAFELYGGVTDRGQELRANYGLKWQTIITMKEWGIDEYDMNGLLNDGISTFKQSFADHEDMLAGTYDKPLSPFYVVWDKGLPYAKKVLRKLKNR